MTTPTDIAAVRALQEQAAALPFGEPGIDYDPAFDVVRAVPALLDELERLREEQRVDLEALKDAQELARELAGDTHIEGLANALEMLWEREGRDACLRQLAYTIPALLNHVALLREERDRLRALESSMRHAFGPNWGKTSTDAEATDAPRLDAYEASRVADAHVDADRELGRRVRESVETHAQHWATLDPEARIPVGSYVASWLRDEIDDLAEAAVAQEMASHAE